MRNKIANGLSIYLWFDPGLKEIAYLIYCRIFLFNLIILIGQLAQAIARWKLDPRIGSNLD